MFPSRRTEMKVMKTSQALDRISYLVLGVALLTVMPVAALSTILEVL